MKNLTNRKLLGYCLAFLTLNLILTALLFYLDERGAVHLDGSYAAPQSNELISGVLMGQVISIPLLSLLLGAIITLFIDKEKPYKKRYIKGFLLTLAIIYGLMTASGFIRLVLSI